MTGTDYKKFKNKLPHGTISRAAKKLGVKPNSVYYQIENDWTETIEIVIDIAQKIRDEKAKKNSKAKQLIDSI